MTSVHTRAIIFLFSLFLSMATSANAAPVTLTAAGEYIMGDNDTVTEGKRLALQDAKRLILEKVGTYIESTTQVKDYVVKSEEIKLYTAGIVKVDEIKEERNVLESKAMVVKVTVKAVVDPDVLVKQIANMRNRTEIEEKSKRYSAENSRLRREIDQLNAQLRSTVNKGKFRDLRKQREAYLDKIQENEQGLTVLLSEGSLFQAALLDRQKRQDDFQTIRTFLKELASAYTIAYNDPEIEDNGNDTANVRIPVSIRLPGSFKVKESNISVASMNALAQTGLIVRGYSDGGLSFACSENINKKQCTSRLKPFIDGQLKAFKIVVKFGRYTVEDTLVSKSILEQRPTRREIQIEAPAAPANIPRRGRLPMRTPIPPRATAASPATAPTPSPAPTAAASVHTTPLSHAKNFVFDFDNVPLAVLKSINRIDIKVIY